MKKSIKLALTAVIALSATSLYATNGSNLIATGAKARAMGGTGVGVSHGAESGLANVSLITSIKATEISFGGMFFMPDVSNNDNINLDFSRRGTVQAPNLGDESGKGSSASDLNVIPEVSIAGKVNDNFYMGIGIWGTAGMGVDYRGNKNSGQMEMVTNLQLMQFAMPLAYTKNNFSIGITPLLQYGSLDINYKLSSALQSAMYMGQTGKLPEQTPQDKNVGSGVAQDLKFGYNLGLAYKIAGFTVGAMYKSQIDMFYKGVLTTAIGSMGVDYKNDALSTPAEIGIGTSYKYAQHTFAIDYKQIKWSDAKGYQDFNWEDQNIISLGYEYLAKEWALRAGYDFADSPISEQTRTVNAQGQETNINSAGLSAGLVNTFNTLGFPGILDSHYTLGGSYNLTEQTSIALAYVYAPEVTIDYKNFLGQSSKTTHSQTSLSFDLVYNF